MVDNFALINFVLGTFAASLGLPIAVVLGYRADAGFVIGLALALIPPILLSPFARDFTRDSEYDPNLASRLLEKHELVCGVGGVVGMFAILVFPIAWLLGFNGRAGAIFVLAGSTICCAVLDVALRRPTLGKNRKSK